MMKMMKKMRYGSFFFFPYSIGVEYNTCDVQCVVYTIVVGVPILSSGEVCGNVGVNISTLHVGVLGSRPGPGNVCLV